MLNSSASACHAYNHFCSRHLEAIASEELTFFQIGGVALKHASLFASAVSFACTVIIKLTHGANVKKLFKVVFTDVYHELETVCQFQAFPGSLNVYG